MVAPLAVVAAHPDDEVLGCGGAIARMAATGRDVHIAILGEGATSRDATRDPASDAVTRLAAQANQAAAILGAASLRMFRLPDNRFDTVPLLDIVKLVEDFLTAAQPSSVLCHHGGDLNIDHRRCFEAVLTATRALPSSTVRHVATYEVASSTDWSFQRVARPFHPNLFVDISSSLDTKIAAMTHYAGELRAFPHPRSIENIRAQAARWGSTAGVAAAEAFEVVRAVL